MTFHFSTKTMNLQKKEKLALSNALVAAMTITGGKHGRNVFVNNTNTEE